MILCHRTDAAEAILREGFQDAEGSYLFEDFTLKGVFLSDVPLDSNEGAKGEQLLEVVFPDGTDLSFWEIVEEGAGDRYREWCLPAEMINRDARVRLLTWDEEGEIVRRMGADNFVG